MTSRGTIRSSAVVIAVIGLGGAASARSEQLTLSGVGTEQTIRCDERDVVINGASQRLSLRGRCARVIVHGADNVVRVERLGRAEVDGLGNRLEWELALNGEHPEVELKGVNNTSVHVADGSGPSRPPQPAVGAQSSLRITSSEAQKTYDCGGGSATVEGSDNRLTLTDCAVLIVTGAENHIVLKGPVRHIRLLGGENEVQWSEGEGGRPPRIELLGGDNHVSRSE